MLKNVEWKKMFRFILSISISFFCFNALGYSIISFDNKNQEVLFAQNELTKIYPASLTKVMSIYTLLSEIEKGSIDLHEKIYIKKTATMQQKTSADLLEGDSVSVFNLAMLSGILSANDAAYAVAENGIESIGRFIYLMNENAKALGMNNTFFTSSHGLHHDEQYSTARDLLTLLNAFTAKYKGYSGFLKSRGFFYNGNLYKQKNLVGKHYKCVNIFKTGYTQASGYNIMLNIACGVYDFSVLAIGFLTSEQRDDYVRRLIDYSIQKINTNNKYDNNLFNYIDEDNSYCSYTVNFILANITAPFALIDKEVETIRKLKSVGNFIYNEYISSQSRDIDMSNYPAPFIL